MATRGKKRKKRNPTPNEVFLSHSHTDIKLVERLAKELRRHGVPAWYNERGIIGAQQWLDEIGAALERCDSFVLLLTPDAVASKWVKHEVTFALNDDRYQGRVIPLMVKTCHFKKLAWPLANLQMITLKPFKKGLRALLRVWGIRYKKS
jgi:hypothetical protein